ncbi:MAG: YbgC/FadM family acyl-CoA thioesterase [Rhizobacter sp.]|nr:YbgC/FadM family acyl-CoA thioesterase [Rhizobacter sp.]
MNRSDFRTLERLRVRWVEVDLQKVVFNGHFLMYFDVAMAGYWRATAMPYAQTMEHFDGDLFVRKASIEYLGSARYDDLLDVGLRCTRIGTSSVLFSGAVFLQDRLLATGELVYVFTEAHAPAPQPVPQSLRDALMAYEAGDAMFNVKLGSWGEWGAAARAIRTEVFIDEQKIPVAMEWDADDDGSVHAVAFNRFGVPLATGRLLAHGASVARVARIGRMATRQAVRGSGIARSVLDALMVASKERGDTEVLLHAQLSAQAFYARAGFKPRGPVFHEAGIAHVEMSRAL